MRKVDEAPGTTTTTNQVENSEFVSDKEGQGEDTPSQTIKVHIEYWYGTQRRSVHETIFLFCFRGVVHETIFLVFLVCFRGVVHETIFFVLFSCGNLGGRLFYSGVLVAYIEFERFFFLRGSQHHVRLQDADRRTKKALEEPLASCSIYREPLLTETLFFW